MIIADGTTTTAVTESNESRRNQSNGELNFLRNANEEPTEQLIELKQKALLSPASVAAARPVSQNAEPREGDNSAAPKTRAVSSEIDSFFSVLRELKEVIEEIKKATKTTNIRSTNYKNGGLQLNSDSIDSTLKNYEDDELLLSDSESLKSLRGPSERAPKNDCR